MLFQNYNIILGSKSPRRKFLLEELGFQVNIQVKEIEENYPNTLPKEEVAEYLALQKANAFNIHEINPNEILVTADTVVIINNTILGKPKTKDEALQMLQSLSGNIHKVITGVCIKTQTKQQSFSALTEVQFRKLDEEEILYYINKYQPFDKAGSYGVQEWIGYIGVEYINGSYFNVMGLPTQMLYKKLKDILA